MKATELLDAAKLIEEYINLNDAHAAGEVANGIGDAKRLAFFEVRAMALAVNDWAVMVTLSNEKHNLSPKLPAFDPEQQRQKALEAVLQFRKMIEGRQTER